MALKPGTLLMNRYRILSVLGQGGMGAVYRAKDEVLSVSVAVKENLFLTDEYTRQFKREASILANLRHPNLPRVGDYCSIPDQGQYLIMDYIEGEDLRQRIARLKVLPENEVTLIGVTICQALNYLHNRQPPIIHRDIKPGNIKITPEGDIFLVDFGLAKSADDPQQATITGARAMTPGYSPHEQYGTARTDARTDVYSLGATLYAALSGEIPEDGLARVTGKAELTSILSWRPNMNIRLANTIERALAVDPDDRYQTANDFKVALLEASELGHLYMDRPTITPPPMKAMKMNGFTRGEDEDDIDQQPENDLSVNRNPASNPKMNTVWWVVGVFITLAILFSFSMWGPLTQGDKQTPTAFITEVTKTIPKTTLSPLKTIETNTVLKVVTPSRENTSQVRTPTLKPTRYFSKTPDLPSPTIEVSLTLVGGGEKIVFVSDRSGNEQIWGMQSDGSQQYQITNIDGGACQPDISSDGSRIVFINPCEGKSDIYKGTHIYMVNADGSSLSQVPIPFSPEGDFDPAWSPDGKKIAFASFRTGVMHIFVYNLDNLELAELSNTLYSDRYPDWSPDGKQIVYSHSKFNYVIRTMTDTGNDVSQYSRSGSVNNYTPSWSPDGSMIIYSQMVMDGSGYPNLVGLNYIDQGTSNEYRITPIGLDVIYPVASASFSHDGKWIVFESWPDGRNHDIYIMDTKGENLTRITTDPGMDFDPSWN